MPRRLRRLGHRVAGRARDQSGTTLIEVLIATAMVGVIVVGTFNGLDASNRVASLGRSRSQGQALAEQDEERLRGEPVANLRALEEAGGKTRTVEQNGAKFTIVSTAKLKNEAGTSSCESGTPEAAIYRTESKVSWTFPHSEKVIETGLITPPPGPSLEVQVNGANGKGVEGMEVKVTGPEGLERVFQGVTTENGCDLFAELPEGGKYKVDVHRTGYVDQNWFEHSKEDTHSQEKWTVVDGVTTKAPYEFEKSGSLIVKLLTSSSALGTLGIGGAEWPGQAINALAQETSRMQVPFKELRPKTSTWLPSTEITSAEQPGVFPFPSPYTVYAGTCASAKPSLFGATNPEALVKAGEVTTAKLQLPALKLLFYSGTTGSPGSLVTTEHPKLKIIEKQSGEGCEEHKWEPTTLPQGSEVQTAARGVLYYPGTPYGKYTACLEVTGPKHYTTAEFELNSTNLTTPREVKVYKGSATTAGGC